MSSPDLIAEGSTSTSTYVNNTYFSLIVQIDNLYERYLDPSMRPAFNLAESYFMSMPVLSTQYILIGDPKSSLAIQQNNVTEPQGNGGLLLYPNPAGEVTNLSFYCTVAGSYRIEVLDLTGKVIMTEDIACNKGMVEQAIGLSSLPEGLFLATVTGPDRVLRTVKFNRQNR